LEAPTNLILHLMSILLEAEIIYLLSSESYFMRRLFPSVRPSVRTITRERFDLGSPNLVYKLLRSILRTSFKMGSKTTLDLWRQRSSVVFDRRGDLWFKTTFFLKWRQMTFGDTWWPLVNYKWEFRQIWPFSTCRNFDTIRKCRKKVKKPKSRKMT
jgi:hypothetical protein